ncbi:MAG TPA: NYN domain-containing protein [Blastocatellia bacterium]|nr:NYN domain-containing protein [Blastocatellia bacterium]
MRSSHTQDNQKIAVFIDFENISLSAANHFGEFDLGLLLKAIQQRGRITLRRAYGDWSRLIKYRDALRENAVELVQLYSYNVQQGGKNRADIRLVIDVMECLFMLDYIDTIVIVSGDSDFSSLMSKAREYGKYTIGVGVQASTSDLLIKSCDEFIFYDKLVEEAYEQIKAPRASSVSEPVIEAPQVAGAHGSLAGSTAPETAPAPVEEKAPVPPPVIIKRAPPSTMAMRAAATTAGSTAAPATRSERETLRYFFEDLRLPVMPPDVRSNTVAELLNAVEPRATLNQAINKLKARYDFENVYRRREDIRAVARLAYRAGLFDFKPEFPSLAAYIKGLNETDPEQANRMVDQRLLRLALESHIRLTTAGATSILFAPARGESYCADLLDELTELEYAERNGNQYFAPGTDAINELLRKPDLAGVKRDLEQFSLPSNDRITLEEADRLFDAASDLRRHDFIASSNCALRGLKILAELYLRREPEVGVDEFLWGAASYCSSRAGAYFRNRDYISARHYYLAFFWITQEGDFAWELLRPLLPSLLSYFWMTLSHEVEARVGSFSGHMAPGDTALALVKELNDYGLDKMEELAFDLATANAAQLRALIAQIETAAQSNEQQRALTVLNSAHDRFMAG